MLAREPTVIGRYALYDEIAAGGMATVHLGRLLGPVGFARTVAIKRLHQQYARDPEFVSMFLDEARLAARIRHPHVVPTLDVVALSGELFLVMDYVHGVSLSKLLREVNLKRIPMPIEIAGSVLVGALRGLHAAHAAVSERGLPLGIVHRDVSPQNVIVGSDGLARVLDFGVAKASWRIQTTRDGQVKGKLSYMAPEQVNGGSVGPWTDVYSAGVVFWEALTDRRLFNRNDSAEILARFTKHEPVTPPSKHNPQVSAALDQIVVKALESDYTRRFASASEMADAIEASVAIASSSAVSRWMDTVVSEQLSRDSALIAGIENGSTPSTRPGEERPSVRRLLASVHDSDGAQPVTRISVPGAEVSERSQISMTRTWPGAEPKGRRKRVMQLSSVAAALLAGLVLWRVWPGAPVAREAPVPNAVAASPVLLAAPPAQPLDTAASAAVTNAPAPSALAAHAAAGKVAHGSASAAHSAVGCNPPYTIDARGIRHLKLACLR